jgi:hypothetical protein
LILFLRYTTSVLLGYCPDDHLATLRPSLLDPYGLARNADFQNMPTRLRLIGAGVHFMILRSA